MTDATTRRRFLALAATAGAVVAATGCGTGGTPGELPRGADIVIGASLELTGASSGVGITQERALRIAVDTVNESGVRYGGQRHQLKLVVRDNASDPATAGVDVEDLVTKDKAVAIIGGGTAPTSLAMAPVAESYSVPMISMSAVELIALPLTKRRFVFTVAPTAASVADVMFTTIARESVHSVSVLAMAGPHGDAGVKAVDDAARPRNVAVRDEQRFAESGADLATRANRVVRDSPDAIIVWAVTTDPGKIAKAVRATGYHGKIFFDAGAGAQAALSDETKDAAEGAQMVHPAALSGSQLAVTTPSGFAQQDFFFRYTRLYGAFSGYAPYGSDAVTMVAEAMRRAGGTAGSRIRDALESAPYEGIAGAYQFSTIKHSGSEPDALAVFVVQRGNWVRVS